VKESFIFFVVLIPGSFLTIAISTVVPIWVSLVIVLIGTVGAWMLLNRLFPDDE
jgi:hypothetical protein